jgi:hypothetical protein
MLPFLPNYTRDPVPLDLSARMPFGLALTFLLGRLGRDNKGTVSVYVHVQLYQFYVCTY